MAIEYNYIVPVYLAYTYSYFLQQDEPEFALIAKSYPTAYHDFIDIMKKSILNNDTKSKQALNTLAFLNPIYIQSIATSSNPSLYQYYQVMLSIEKSLAEINPALVFNFEYLDMNQRAFKPALISLLVGNETLETLIKAKLAVINSALADPHAILTTDENAQAMQLLSSIMQPLRDQYGSDFGKSFTTDYTNPSFNKKQAVEIHAKFMSDILSKGPENTGKIIKTLMNKKN